MKKPHPNTQMA